MQCTKCKKNKRKITMAEMEKNLSDFIIWFGKYTLLFLLPLIQNEQKHRERDGRKEAAAIK